MTPFTTIDLWDPLGFIEDSPNNLAKRKAINDIAKKYDGSIVWAKDAAKGPMKECTYKCSQFVFDVTREAGARLPLIGGGFPLAGILADTNRNLKDWRLLAPGEAPMPRDIAAYPITGSTAATGHTGFIVSDGAGGATNISAHSDGVYSTPGQFTSETGLSFRRYIGE